VVRAFQDIFYRYRNLESCYKIKKKNLIRIHPEAHIVTRSERGKEYARNVETSINVRVARNMIRWKKTRRRSASRVHLQYESAGLRTVRVYIIILDAGYTYLYKEGFTYIPRAGIRYGIFMAYCNALGNFVINVRNGEERRGKP